MVSSCHAFSAVQWSYDVFLSFRGEDTRRNFTDHLYTALNQNGICTFRDDEELERGKEISSELLYAIEKSMFSIIILSRNYAFSTWCLDELAKIVDCIKEEQHTAFPVFYDVDPSDVREQTGEFKKAFDKHERDFKDEKEKVERWRSALTQVANLSGWHLQGRHESKVIQKIVNDISRKLDVAFPTSVAKDLVGIESRVKELIPYLRLRSNNVRFIGIYGMGGIGKTTLARVVYDSLSSNFEGSCFLENVRELTERGLIPLQKQLLSEVLKVKYVSILDVHKAIRRRLCRQRVLLVLDDVDQLRQLKELAGEPDWFGHGSRIIITTRDEQLLIAHGVQYRYRVRGLDDAEATKLFHLKAFKHEKPTYEQFELSKHVINYTQHLPLALVVVGSSLCDGNVVSWRSTLDRLRIFPDKAILNALRISYDGLHDTEKQIFLDIACFFKGKEKDRVMEILDGCGFYPDAGVKALIQKSLVKIVDNKFWMHDLVQILGWEIIREKYRCEPGKWSRLWECKNIYHVLQKNKGTGAVECIVLDQPKKEIKWLNGKSFSDMRNLRLLQISNFQLLGDLEYLSNELRFFDWQRYPSKSLPSSFYPENLIELRMCYSHIEYLWKGIKSFKKLKTIDLSHSSKLIRMPDFTEVPNLERLNLEGCGSLLVVDQSVGALERLTVLNLKNCKNLISFPSRICGLKSLKLLNLHGCSKLDKLPQDLGEVKCLKALDLRGAGIRQVPSSIVRLRNLEALSFSGCKEQPTQWILTGLYRWMMPKRNSVSMQLLLPPFSGLFSLKILDIVDCNLLEGGIPNDIGSLFSLEELNLSGSNFLSIPQSIKELSKLKILRLDNCQSLQSLPGLPPKINFLGVENCTSLHVKTLSRALKNCTSTDVALHFSNGCKLVNDQGRGNSAGVELLNSWLEQDLYNQASQFHIRVPGSEIPSFFTHWIDQSSIKIKIPSRRVEKIKGFAVCFVLEAPGHQAEINCGLSIESSNFRFKILNSTTNIDSGHLCLSYISKRLLQISVSGIEHPPVSVGFYATDGSPSFVKKCGIFPFYSHASIRKFNHCPQVTRVKRAAVKSRIFSEIFSGIEPKRRRVS